MFFLNIFKKSKVYNQTIKNFVSKEKLRTQLLEQQNKLKSTQVEFTTARSDLDPKSITLCAYSAGYYNVISSLWNWIFLNFYFISKSLPADFESWKESILKKSENLIKFSSTVSESIDRFVAGL